MATPFAVDAPLSGLPYPFPKPDDLRAALSVDERRAREIIVRLWISEGVPFAFQRCPAVFEEVRGWLGSKLDVHPKQITLIGSARIGYSLAGSEFGRPFGEHSDLDFSVISAPLFERVAESFRLFSNDYKSQIIKPRNENERRYWDDIVRYGEANVMKGFLDGGKIPTFDRYPVSQQINQAMWALGERLEATAESPKIRKASTRVYRSWQCFVDQVTLNLLYIYRSWKR